jgi:sigma-E factor negative regulatory protein RseC
MIEQVATVVAVEGDAAWVETYRRSACGACAMNKGCGAGLFAKAFGFDSPQLKVTRAEGVDIGDRVVVGIDERALVRGSFAAYMMPLLFMMGFAIAGQALLPPGPVLGSDLAAILTGGVGLAAGLLWLKRHNRRIRHDSRYQPLILHKVADEAPLSCPKTAT